jgi:hypothetical protein
VRTKEITVKRSRTLIRFYPRLLPPEFAVAGLKDARRKRLYEPYAPKICLSVVLGMANPHGPRKVTRLDNKNVKIIVNKITMDNAMSNVVQLPRPHRLRPSPARLGYYLRVGRNDHTTVAHLLAEGEQAYLGLVIEAQHATRHRDLIATATARGFDVVLDPKSQPAAFVGGFSPSLGDLPWGLGRQATLADYSGDHGIRRADEIATFVHDHGLSAVLAPTHLIASANDPWFDTDRRVAARLRSLLPAGAGLVYSLAVPIQLLREPGERNALIEGLRGVDIDALWLKIENFGADATGEKVRAYVEAVAAFHELGIPLIADHVAGLPSLASLAFGAVGGIAHGIMMFEGFKPSAWRRPPNNEHQPRTPAPRVYLQALDMLVSRQQAAELFEHSTRVRGQHACRDPRCCPRGVRDMLEHPGRHYCYSHARQVEALNGTPAAQRVGAFMEQTLRPRSDALAAAASLNLGDEKLLDSLQKRHRNMGRLRGVLAHMAETYEPASIAQSPLSREQREGK